MKGPPLKEPLNWIPPLKLISEISAHLPGGHNREAATQSRWKISACASQKSSQGLSSAKAFRPVNAPTNPTLMNCQNALRRDMPFARFLDSRSNDSFISHFSS